MKVLSEVIEWAIMALFSVIFCLVCFGVVDFGNKLAALAGSLLFLFFSACNLFDRDAAAS